MRQGMSQRVAYIDIDAHKPDGVWKEVDHLCQLPRVRRRTVLNGMPDACEGVYFASVHVNGYPNPQQNWQSVARTIPKSHKRAFSVRLQEELLPSGVADGSVPNGVVLDAFKKWRTSVSTDLRDLKPNGLFVGLGLDLHEYEKNVGDKQVGRGLKRQHYRELIQGFPSTALRGPVVLTLEGGYTKAGVIDGMLGVISGLEVLSRRARTSRGVARRFLTKAKGDSSLKLKSVKSVKSHPAAPACSGKRKRLSGA